MKNVIALLLGILTTFNSYSKNIPYSKEEITWLVKNVYFEARNQKTAGKIAVINVTLNRVKSPLFPNTIKGVVTQRNPRGCQFSWYCDDKPDYITDWESYEKIQKIVLTHIILLDKMIDITDGALYYHADHVMPPWAATKERVIKIENHIFYK
jgi:spore germination cell wall hydrolase CwlJ-like protein